MFHAEVIVDQKYFGLNPVQFGHEDCKPGHSFGPFVRTHWLLHYVQSGKGIFEREGKKYKVSEGDIFVIPPYKQTYYEADLKQPWEYTWIGFTSGELFLNTLPAVIRIQSAEKIFREMSQCANLGAGKSAFLSSKLWELFSFYLEGKPEEEPDYVKYALNRIQTEYMNGIKIESIASELHIDRSYLSTLFSRYMGVSIKDYLTDLRLNKAAELMKEYGQSPSSAAFSTGYSDIYNFSKMFKKKFGVSPRNFMKGNM